MSPAATLTVDGAHRRVLDAADILFYERGISGVAIADIRDASGVSLRRIYVLYPSKKDLVAAWLNDRHDRWMSWFTGSVDRHIGNGVDPVLAAFDTLADWTRSPGYRGCAFVNAIAEPMVIDDHHRSIVNSHKRSLVSYLAKLASLSHTRIPDWFPNVLGVLFDGAIVQAVIVGNDEPVIAARNATAQLLRTMQ
jgi:AcrR family transcriptional regulator